VTSLGIAADCWIAGGIALVGAVTFVALGSRRTATGLLESRTDGAHDRESAATATPLP